MRVIFEKNIDMSSEIGVGNDGMSIYEYVVDNAFSDNLVMGDVVSRLRRVDVSGQFLASTARYLAAVDRPRFEAWIAPLVEAAIEKDRDRKYIGALLDALWGENYMERADELSRTDDNFRRIYKRIYPTGAL